MLENFFKHNFSASKLWKYIFMHAICFLSEINFNKQCDFHKCTNHVHGNIEEFETVITLMW